MQVLVVYFFVLLKRVIGKVQCLREKKLKQRRHQGGFKQRARHPNLQTGKDTNIMRKIYQSSRFL